MSEIWDILNFNEKRRIVRSLVKEIVITDNNIKNLLSVLTIYIRADDYRRNKKIFKR